MLLLELYLRAHPRVGETCMFPQRRFPNEPMTMPDARILRLRAEALAKLPLVEHGGFHSFRRLYAVERKHLPDVDVAR